MSGFNFGDYFSQNVQCWLLMDKPNIAQWKQMKRQLKQMEREIKQAADKLKKDNDEMEQALQTLMFMFKRNRQGV